MANFTYVGLDANGKEKKGTVTADDREKAFGAIKAMNLIPVSVAEETFLNKDINISLTKGAKVRDKSLFCRQFASLLRAGVTIVASLQMLSESTENKGLAAAINQLSISIQKGETLGMSMRNYPEYFDSMLISLVDAGEASGSLDKSLDRMASQYEKDAKLQGTVKKAMIYPAVVLVVAVGVVIVMLTWVVPSFMKMFAGLDMEMPAITMAVVHLSDWMVAHWIPLVIGLIIVVIVLRFFLKSDRGQAFTSYLGVKIPAIQDFTVKSAASRLSRTLSTLLGSGLTTIDALEITAHTMTNTLFRDALEDARQDVLKGVPLSEPLKRCGLFPPMVIHMIKIGEDTGDMESMLNKLADYYDEEVELATQSLLAALEPMIILVLAGIVGILLAAVMAPMIQLYTGLDTNL